MSTGVIAVQLGVSSLARPLVMRSDVGRRMWWTGKR